MNENKQKYTSLAKFIMNTIVSFITFFYQIVLFLFFDFIEMGFFFSLVCC